MTTSCIEWSGSRNHKGYGKQTINGRTFRAHRVAYERTFGAIPDGMIIRHRCDNPPCVNPEHLVLGTHADNMRDMVERGRHHNTRKTHCVRGHEFNQENTSYRSRGERRCLACHRGRNR